MPFFFLLKIIVSAFTHMSKGGAFANMAPKVRNSLPHIDKMNDSVNIFKFGLKTHRYGLF